MGATGSIFWLSLPVATEDLRRAGDRTRTMYRDEVQVIGGQLAGLGALEPRTRRQALVAAARSCHWDYPVEEGAALEVSGRYQGGWAWTEVSGPEGFAACVAASSQEPAVPEDQLVEPRAIAR